MAWDSELRAIIWLGLGDLFVFGSFFSQLEIQNEVVTAYAASGHNINTDAGYYSQSIYYVGYALSALGTAPLITSFGPKAAMIVSTIVVLVYLCTFLFLNEYLLYVVSVFAGVAMGVLRSSRGHYMACISQPHNLNRNTAVYWFLFFMSQPLSAGFLYAVLYDQTNMTDARIRLIYGLLMCTTCIGLLCKWLMPAVMAQHRTKAVANYRTEADEARGKLTRLIRFGLYENVKMFRLAITTCGLCLVPVFLAVGVQVVLYSSVYPTSLGFVSSLDMDGPTLIALHNLCAGIGSIVVCIGAVSPIVGVWSRRAGRAPVYMLQMAVALVTYLLVFINLPEAAPLHHTDDRGFITPNRVLALACSFLMGAYGAMGANCNSSLLAALYPGDEAAQAFNWTAFMQTAFAVVISLYASKLLLGWQLLIAALLAVAAAAFNIVLEWKAQANPKGLMFD